ncbi:MAG: hypothetical protein P8R42_25300 [Candidatus Binatia bacterium]|nr:hypothetical protein [Candidatus Binatia bacterium]
MDEAEEALRLGLGLAERISYPRGAWQVHGALADLALRRGDRAEHERHGTRKEALLKRAVDSLEDDDLRSRLRACAAAA